MRRARSAIHTIATAPMQTIPIIRIVLVIVIGMFVVSQTICDRRSNPHLIAKPNAHAAGRSGNR